MKNEGWKGFWRGNTATLLKIVPSVGINLAIYDELSNVIRTKTSLSNNANSLISGAIAGCTSTAVTYPVENVRVMLSMEGAKVSFKGEREVVVLNIFKIFFLFKNK